MDFTSATLKPQAPVALPVRIFWRTSCQTSTSSISIENSCHGAGNRFKSAWNEGLQPPPRCPAANTSSSRYENLHGARSVCSHCAFGTTPPGQEGPGHQMPPARVHYKHQPPNPQFHPRSRDDPDGRGEAFQRTKTTLPGNPRSMPESAAQFQ